jgi:hypothetical protein
MRTFSDEETIEQVEQTDAVEAGREVEDQPRKRLDSLMRKVLARRDEVRSTQQKLRDIEVELRQAPDDKRGRFERMREAALNEYRNARAEAARTRHQLVSMLRMLPSRS